MAADRDALLLAIIAEAIADIDRRLCNWDMQEFLDDRDEQALTAFRLSIIGENCNKLSDQVKMRHPLLPWADMVAFRNIVSHEYHRVDAALVWEATQSLHDIAAMVDAEQSASGEKG